MLPSVNLVPFPSQTVPHKPSDYQPGNSSMLGGVDCSHTGTHIDWHRQTGNVVWFSLIWDCFLELFKFVRVEIRFLTDSVRVKHTLVINAMGMSYRLVVRQHCKTPMRDTVVTIWMCAEMQSVYSHWTVFNVTTAWPASHQLLSVVTECF